MVDAPLLCPLVQLKLSRLAPGPYNRLHRIRERLRLVRSDEVGHDAYGLIGEGFEGNRPPLYDPLDPLVVDGPRLLGTQDGVLNAQESLHRFIEEQGCAHATSLRLSAAAASTSANRISQSSRTVPRPWARSANSRYAGVPPNVGPC